MSWPDSCWTAWASGSGSASITGRIGSRSGPASVSPSGSGCLLCWSGGVAPESYCMSGQLRLNGVVPIIPTPFRADETIDLEGLGRCVDFAVRCRVCAICLPAYASEFPKLTEAERFQVIETAIKAAAGKIAVLAQSNYPSAHCAAELARRHADLGADLISFAIPRQFA